jgi:hypothetical protein
MRRWSPAGTAGDLAIPTQVVAQRARAVYPLSIHVDGSTLLQKPATVRPDYAEPAHGCIRPAEGKRGR